MRSHTTALRYIGGWEIVQALRLACVRDADESTPRKFAESRLIDSQAYPP